MKTKTKTAGTNSPTTSNPLDLLAPTGHRLCMDHDNNVSRISFGDAQERPKPQVTKSSGSEITFRVEKIGTVRVDGGAVVIVDPLHAHDVNEQWDDLEEITRQFGSERLDDSCVFVRSLTGLGDGRYPVFATIINDPEEPMGNREWVGALHIPFLSAISMGRGKEQVQAAEMEFREFLESEEI
jgi:hypothetical protein